MKLKQKPSDFRVTELLKDDYLTETGKHHVYKVTKRKLTSMEAAAALADLANVKVSDVSMAGLKDRQGVTVQFMSFPGGKKVSLDTAELKIEAVGCAKESLSSANSYGNGFEVRLRDLTPVESRRLIAHKQVVARLGVPNYFDEQRFGNLKHSQGWVAKELMLGNHETALRNLLCAESQHDNGRHGAFKEALRNNWGNWSECRDIAGRFGEHHSVFDFLGKDPANFAGAFFHVSSRLRLIHLYAFQSHIWNRAVAAYFAKLCGNNGARVAYTLEGPQVFPDGRLDVDITFAGCFRLPGEGLEDVEHVEQRRLLAEALADEGLVPAQFKISGVSGFQLKGEDRRLFIRPRHLKISEKKMTGEDGDTCDMSFELPRGAYATLVIRGLLARFAKGSVDPKGFVVPQHQADDERAVKDAPSWKERAAQRGSGGGASQGAARTGGWQGREGNSAGGGERSYGGGGGQRQGGWQGRDDNRGGGERSYGGGGGQRQGGWQGRDDSSGGGQRSYGGGQSQGGWKGRDDSSGGGQRSYGGGQSQGGWKGRDDNSGGGQRSYGGGQSQGGWKGRDDNSGGGQRSYGGGQSQGGWKGRDDNSGGGQRSYGGGQSQGGWKGRDDSSGGGQRSYGGGQSQGGWKGRDDSSGGGQRSYGGGQSQGGWKGRDDSSGGGQRSYGGGQSQGGWKGRDDNSGGGQRSYGGGQSQGGWKGRDDNSGGGQRSYGGGQSQGGWKPNRSADSRWSKDGQDSGRTSGGYSQDRQQGGGYGGGQSQGGWKGRDDNSGGGGQRSYGGGQSQGGWKGRDDNSGGGGQRSYGGGQSQGGWKGRDDNSSGGGQRSYGGGQSQGGWKGRDDNSGGGGQRSYGGGQSQGGWKGRDDNSSGGGQRSYGGGQSQGGWKGRDDNSGGGQRSYGGGQSQGAWKGRDAQSGDKDRPRGKRWEGANVEPPALKPRSENSGGSSPEGSDS